MRSKKELLQVVALPITDNAAKDIVRGTLALAYKLSPEMAMEIIPPVISSAYLLILHPSVKYLTSGLAILPA